MYVYSTGNLPVNFSLNKLFMHKLARKIDKKWKDEQRMKKRLRAMKLREEVVQNSDGMELDVDE